MSQSATSLTVITNLRSVALGQREASLLLALSCSGVARQAYAMLARRLRCVSAVLQRLRVRSLARASTAL